MLFFSIVVLQVSSISTHEDIDTTDDDTQTYDSNNLTHLTYHFATMNEFNNPPYIPNIISGPTAGGPEIELHFSAISEDPDEDQIYYLWDWGDGNISDWLGPFDSNDSMTANHSWFNDGEYKIRVKAKDEAANESEWSAPFNISIAKQIYISNIKAGFIYFRFFGANNSYLFISLLESLGVSAIIGDGGLGIKAEATENVNSTSFEIIDCILGENLTQYDDNGSDGFSSKMDIPTGLWELTVYAYDSDGNMIDIGKVDYLVFINHGSEEEQQFTMLSNLRGRVIHRILNH